MTEKLRQMAQHDPLTGLPNRARFQVRLDQVLAGAQRQGNCNAVLFVALDNFKAVNDRLGHAGGDQALSWVAQKL